MHRVPVITIAGASLVLFLATVKPEIAVVQAVRPAFDTAEYPRWRGAVRVITSYSIHYTKLYEVDVEVQAAALERVAHLAGVVRGQEDERAPRRVDRPSYNFV